MATVPGPAGMAAYRFVVGPRNRPSGRTACSHEKRRILAKPAYYGKPADAPLPGRQVRRPGPGGTPA